MKKLLSLVLALAMGVSVTAASAAPIKDFSDYQTQANEMETFCIQHSQGAVDLNVLGNCIDGLLTNDNHGNLVGNIAKEWSSPDGGETWNFVLVDNATWSDYQGNVHAPVVAEDFLWGLEFVLNYAKNEAANTSMAIEMIKGAGDYYEYTKSLPTEEAMALGLDKFLEMVGIEAPDATHLTYHCLGQLSYFPTLATYNCLSPVSGKLLEAIGPDGYLGCDHTTLWYNGPYTITEYIHQNSKTLTRNPNWFGLADNTTFDTVTVHMVESGDQAYQLFQTGEIDYISLTQSNLKTIYDSTSHEFHDYLVEARPTKYSYQIHLVYDKKLADGTPDVNWNTAVANEAFRLAWYYGLDATPFLARTNFINPQTCQNYCYTANAVATTSTGVDYTKLVRDELGLDYNNETYNRVDADKAAAYKAQAIEELTAKGVTFPVTIDYWISGSSQTAMDYAVTLQQMFSDCLGDDFVQLKINTYVSSLAQEVRNPQLASLFINGWGADFGDPINFLGQETYGEGNAYYSVSYSKINNATDEELIATYKTFTQMVNEAKAETADLDARFAAFAKAEAYAIEHALFIPWYYSVSWQLTCVNDYSKIYTAYGMQNTRYVNWETDDQIYTTADYSQFAVDYDAQ